MAPSPSRLRLGVLTIGQSPRTDVVPEIRPFLGDRVELVEAGALDGLDRAAVDTLAPGPGDQVLVTRMADGSEVRVAGHHLIPRLQAVIDRLEQEVGAFLLLCTGTFPPFRTNRLIVYPEQLLFHVVQAVAPGRHVGVLTPNEAQIPEQEARWAPHAARVTVAAVSPYRQPVDVEPPARALAAAGADLVVMDCLGYTLAMKAAVRDIVQRPVILARSLLGRVAGELV